MRPGWRGALGITYHIGGGPAKVHLAVKFDWQVRPLYDVIAKIPGATFPDEWIIRGNHHDAWVTFLSARGWRQGPRDDAARTHPNLAAWDDLPEEQRDKDRVFLGIVISMTLGD